MIVSREAIRLAVQRALHLDQRHDLNAAVDAVAQALCLPRETVIEACEVEGQTA